MTSIRKLNGHHNKSNFSKYIEIIVKKTFSVIVNLS